MQGGHFLDTQAKFKMWLNRLEYASSTQSGYAYPLSTDSVLGYRDWVILAIYYDCSLRRCEGERLKLHLDTQGKNS